MSRLVGMKKPSDEFQRGNRLKCDEAIFQRLKPQERRNQEPIGGSFRGRKKPHVQSEIMSYSEV